MELDSRKKLNIGCGYNKIVDAINVDIDPRCGPDMIIDAGEPLPFDDGRFDVVYVSQVLEHVMNYVDLVRDIHRVLKLGGLFYAGVPYWTGRNAVACPDHVRYFNQETFLTFCDPRFYQPKCGICDYEGMFDSVKMQIYKHDMNKDGFDLPGSLSGSYTAAIEVILKKVDKAYWIDKDITKNLTLDVKGCFFCSHELGWVDKPTKKACLNCGEIYTFDVNKIEEFNG